MYLSVWPALNFNLTTTVPPVLNGAIPVRQAVALTSQQSEVRPQTIYHTLRLHVTVYSITPTYMHNSCIQMDTLRGLGIHGGDLHRVFTFPGIHHPWSPCRFSRPIWGGSEAVAQRAMLWSSCKHSYTQYMVWDSHHACNWGWSTYYSLCTWQLVWCAISCHSDRYDSLVHVHASSNMQLECSVVLVL